MPKTKTCELLLPLLVMIGLLTGAVVKICHHFYCGAAHYHKVVAQIELWQRRNVSHGWNEGLLVDQAASSSTRLNKGLLTRASH